MLKTKEVNPRSVATLCTPLCLFILGFCYTIGDVGGQQLGNRLWVAGTTQLAQAQAVNLEEDTPS